MTYWNEPNKDSQDDVETMSSQINYYNKGKTADFMVTFRRPFKTSDNDDYQFKGGETIPLMYAKGIKQGNNL